MLLEEDAELRKSIQVRSPMLRSPAAHLSRVVTHFDACHPAQEEERRKLEKDNEARLEERLAEEKRRLVEEAERERAALKEKYASSTQSTEKELALEEALLSAQSDKSMLLLQINELKAKHAAEVERLRTEHRRAMHTAKVSARWGGVGWGELVRSANASSQRLPLPPPSAAALVPTRQMEELHMFRTMIEGFEREKRDLEGRVGELSTLLKDAVRDITHLTERNGVLERQLIEAAAWEPSTT